MTLPSGQENVGVAHLAVTSTSLPSGFARDKSIHEYRNVQNSCIHVRVNVYNLEIENLNALNRD